MENTILDKRVKAGMVYTGGSGGKETYVVKRVSENEVTSAELFDGCDYSDGWVFRGSGNIHWSGHGWFRPGSFEFIHQMSEREFKKTFKS